MVPWDRVFLLLKLNFKSFELPKGFEQYAHAVSSNLNREGENCPIYIQKAMWRSYDMQSYDLWLSA